MSALIRIVVAVVTTGVATACRTERVEQVPPPAAPPADVRAGAAKGDFAPVVAYARTLEYDTVAGAGDRQRLMVGRRCPPWAPGGDCRYGPLARIEPQSHAHQIPDTFDLAAGRVVARIITTDSAYRKLNLRANDTTYWWVDRPGGREGNWRAVFLSSDPGVHPVIVTNARLWHLAGRRSAERPYTERRYSWGHASARFVWSERDEAVWATCTMYGCCQSADDLR